MVQLQKAEKREYEPIPDNIYFVKILEIAEKVSKKGNAYLNWKFEIQQNPFQKRWVFGSTSKVVSPKSRLGSWLNSLGISPEQAVNLDTDQLLGVYTKAFVKSTVGENDEEYQNVDSLVAMTEVDTQVLQTMLAQAPLAHGPAKVAVQATSVVSQQVPVTVATPVAPVVNVQPVVAPVAPRATSKFPF
jgi:hypothetical protein